MIRLAETRGKLIAVCRGTEPNATGRTIRYASRQGLVPMRERCPDGKPDDRGLLLRWSGMSEDERDKYTNRVLPVLEAFLDH